jgi:hypothetical protein
LGRNRQFRLSLGHALVTRKSKRREGMTLVTQKRGFSTFGARVVGVLRVISGQWSVVSGQI